MKRAVLLLIVLLVLTGIVSAQSMVVKTPKQNDILYKGKTYNITWTNTGCTGPYVKINIFKNSIATTNFIEQIVTQNGGSTSWKVPASYTDGKYVLRVKADPPVENCYGDSGVFNIKKKTNFSIAYTPPKIYKKPVIGFAKVKGVVKITSPITNGSYEENKAMTISWNKNLGSNSKVNIFLCTETDDQGEKIFTETTNSGNVQWIPPSDKLSWPGNRPYIKIVTPDNFYSGKSGLFSIVPPPIPHQPKKKTIARTPVLKNNHTRNWNLTNHNDCLSAPTPGIQGRAPTSAELKTGHHISEGKYKECSWVLSYTFTGDMIFDVPELRGKTIIRAELLLSLSDHIQALPPTTNATCSSMSRIFDKNGLVTTFNILIPGEKTKLNLLNSVKSWAASNQSNTYSLTIKDNKDVVSYLSVCLKYYSQPILFIDYME